MLRTRIIPAVGACVVLSLVLFALMGAFSTTLTPNSHPTLPTSDFDVSDPDMLRTRIIPAASQTPMRWGSSSATSMRRPGVAAAETAEIPFESAETPLLDGAASATRKDSVVVDHGTEITPLATSPAPASTEILEALPSVTPEIPPLPSTPAAPPRPAPSAPSTRIPRIIHQTWSNKDVPEDFEPYIASWLQHHPTWEYRFWTDEDNRALVEEHFPSFLDTFDGLTQGMPGFVRRLGIRQADAIRYMIMYKEGGVYVDLDFEALKPLDGLMQMQHELVMGQEPLAHANLLNGMERTVCNALLMSSAGHPFWKHVLDTISEGSHGDPVDTTGPRMLERAMGTYQETNSAAEHPIWVAPPDLFYPKFDPGALDNLRSTCERGSEWESTCRMLEERGWSTDPRPESVATHHWTHTWLGTRDGANTVNVDEIISNSRK